MKLNLKFYKGKDEYSDGIIENKIIEFIKKYPDNYEKSFKEDFSWPVFYHLSELRKNVIRWYPFKENASILEVGAGMGALTSELCNRCKNVTSIELSKKRATAILERNKKAKNLEIIVGNFEDIILKKKYDYILLNGVLEYGAMYINSNNPYEDFINSLKKNLKDDGKILIAIENKFGLKYWCGANEDHTGIPFDSINNYHSHSKIRTFSKIELENIAKKCNLQANFYYLFPDYKFTKVVYTDESLKKNICANYNPYYCDSMDLVANEINVYHEIFENNEIPFFANSYLIELSEKKQKPQIEFVKMNNEYRKENYNIYTYLKNNKFYKKAITKCALTKIEEIMHNTKLLKESKVEFAPIYQENDEIYSKFVDGINLNDLLIKNYYSEKFTEFYQILDSIYKLAIKCAGKKLKNIPQENVFTKYNINLEQEILKQMHFYEHGFIDIVASNIVIKDKKMILIDQEWYEKNCPIEYVMYRVITVFLGDIEDQFNIKEEIYKHFNINPKYFYELEKNFSNSTKNELYNIYLSYTAKGMYLSNLRQIIDEHKLLASNYPNLVRENEKISQENKILISENDNQKQTIIKCKEEIKNIRLISEEKSKVINLLQEQLDYYQQKIKEILSSHSWFITKPFRKIVSFFKKDGSI